MHTLCVCMCICVYVCVHTFSEGYCHCRVLASVIFGTRSPQKVTKFITKEYKHFVCLLLSFP